MAADKERAALMVEAETATDPERIADIQMRLVDIDAHSAEARASSILAGLGFDQEAQFRPASSFSGDWCMRAALASVLSAEPDLLILDEPTNHLDIDSRHALIEALNDYDGAVIPISHDRHLIEATVDRLWLVNNGTVTTFEGDMDEYRDLVVSSGKRKRRNDVVVNPTSKARQPKANAFFVVA